MKRRIFYGISMVTILLAAYFFLKPRATTLPPGHLKSLLPAKYAKTASQKPDSYLIRNVSVIPMTLDTILVHRQVLIENGRIKQIVKSVELINTLSRPFEIDGTGKFLIPGLNDMHVHINDDNNLLLFIANGVTTVRNMAGSPFHLDLRNKINKRDILGPEIYAASPILEGVDKVWKFSVGLNSKSEARGAVKKYSSEGYDFIKIYHTLPADLYQEILRVGDSVGIPVVGHIPFQVDLSETLSLSQYSLEHVDPRPVSPGISLIKKLEMIGKSGKWMCPTLMVFRNIQRNPLHPSILTDYEKYTDDQTWKFWNDHLRFFGPNDYKLQKSMAKIIFNNGGRFITGTDCLNSYVLAGFSIHEELEEMVDAGIPEFEVLKASTINPAIFLKRQDAGTIEEGKIADLVLLDANPLDQISNTRRISGVMVKGRWFDKKDIEGMLREVRNSY